MIVNNKVRLNNHNKICYLNLKKICKLIFSTSNGILLKKNLKNYNMANCSNNYITNPKFMINMI